MALDAEVLPSAVRPSLSSCCVPEPNRPCSSSSQISFDGDGLLHDARNLLGAIGLYCDLLSLPGVLKPEHSNYPIELRHLGARSQALIEQLMQSLPSREIPNMPPISPSEPSSTSSPGLPCEPLQRHGRPADEVKPISLRRVVERCSGLLSRVACGRAIDVVYGAAADAPVNIAEESLERILVNLVRNSSAALGDAPGGSGAIQPEPPSGSQATIRISVGSMSGRYGEARLWPLQRVRLVVEDSGSGMEPSQLSCLLSERSIVRRDTHGIGFRVVRDLSAASSGELRVTSTPGVGTRVQIEWPIAGASLAAPGADLPALRVAADPPNIRRNSPAGGKRSRRVDEYSTPERLGVC